jgi:hypothetical protein
MGGWQGKIDDDWGKIEGDIGRDGKDRG